MNVTAALAKAPWNDRQGRFSVLKAAALAGAVIPGVWLGWRWANGDLSLLPLAPLIYYSGNFAGWLLLAALAVTPARRLFGLGRLILIRRLLGVSAFLYVVGHLVVYAFLRELDWAAMGREALGRPTILVALAAVLGLAALAATSTDAAIRRLGPAWQRLHRLVYPAAALALLHYVLSPGSVGGAPYLMVGVFGWLTAWRLLERRGLGSDARVLLGLALGAALACALFEAAAVQLFHGYDAVSTLKANLGFDIGPSAALETLVFGLIVTAAKVAADALRARKVKA